VSNNKRGSNVPPVLDQLTDAQRAAVLDGADAVETYNDFRRRTFDVFMRIARGVAPLCDWAKGKSRKARRNTLNETGYRTINESTVSRLLWMAKLETEIRIWRDSLTERKRDTWNSPTSICNRCPAVRKAMAAAKVAAKANKRQGSAPAKTKTTVSARFEKALDVIADALHEAEDADLRASMVERIASLIGSQIAAAQPKAKAPPASDVLKWIEDQDGWPSAAHGRGTIQISRSFSMPLLGGGGKTTEQCAASYYVPNKGPSLNIGFASDIKKTKALVAKRLHKSPSLDEELDERNRLEAEATAERKAKRLAREAAAKALAEQDLAKPKGKAK
jgi:hypothetical protein